MAPEAIIYYFYSSQCVNIQKRRRRERETEAKTVENRKKIEGNEGGGE